MLKIFSAACLLFTSHLVVAQEQGDYFISNFYRSDYDASFSNFGVLQASNGLIYVANFDGVLEYDGQEWRRYPIANNSVVLSIADHKGTIYAGALKEFGYFKPNPAGHLTYHSLSSKVSETTRFNAVRAIISTPGGVYFFSGEAIFLFNDQHELVQVWEAGEHKFYFSLIQQEGKFYCLREKYGLVELNESTQSLLPPEQVESWSAMTFIDKMEGDYVIGTLSKGIYRWDGQRIHELQTPLSVYGSKNFLSAGRTFNEHLQAFGTFKGGIVVSDSSFRLSAIIDKQGGLQSENIKDLYFDHQGGLWAAMQEGVARVEINSPWTQWQRELDFKGVPWDLAISNGVFYLATSEGLYYKEGMAFRKVEGIDSKVWSLSNIHNYKGDEEVLLVGTNDGLFEVRDNSSKEIFNFPIVNKLSRNTNMDSLVIVGHRYGLSAVGYDKNGDYFQRDLAEILNNTYQDMLLDPHGVLWATSKFIGVYRVTGIHGQSAETSLFTTEHGLPDVNKWNIHYQGDTVRFASDDGVYFFDDHTSADSAKFKRDTTFSRERTLFTQLVNGAYKIAGGASTFGLTDAWLPYRRLPEMEIMKVYPGEDDILWVAGSDGLFRFDGNIRQDYGQSFYTLIRKITTSDSLLFNGATTVDHFSQDSSTVLPYVEAPVELTYSFNNVRFEFAATNYEMPWKNTYSYYLENNDKQWSAWTPESRKEYNNLSPGEYTFHVKSKNAYDTEGSMVHYSFIILPPWYETNWAKALFAGLAILGVWFIVMGYSYRVRMQRRRLKLIVADRTFEVMSQKKEIEQQNALLKKQNAEISHQKEDIELKNHLLNESQTKVLVINRELKELNLSLEKKIDDRTSKIKATLKKLQQINQELDTFIYRASHDLKGPISRIHGLTALAKLQTLDGPNARYFNLIQDTTREMEMLLSKLIQVHEILNLEVCKEEVDIPSLLHEIRESVKFLDKTKDTKYSFELDEQVTLFTDRYLISIIFKNLVDNALTFKNPTRKVPHEVKVTTCKSNGTFVFKVFDTGIGIDPLHFEKIYTMFFKGSNLSKGNGLGLYLVKLASDKLGATVEMTSKKGEFSEFTVRIPT